jgi:hypothetical protein
MVTTIESRSEYQFVDRRSIEAVTRHAAGRVVR